MHFFFKKKIFDLLLPKLHFVLIGIIPKTYTMTMNFRMYNLPEDMNKALGFSSDN